MAHAKSQIRSMEVPALLGSSLAAAVIAGILIGILFHLTGRMEAVAGLYGLEGVVFGWGVHLFHSLLAGAIFGLIVIPALNAIEGPMFDLQEALGLYGMGILVGLVFGLILWIVFVAVGLPLWLGIFVGSETSIPYFTWMSLVGVVGFGVLVGLLVPALQMARL